MSLLCQRYAPGKTLRRGVADALCRDQGHVEEASGGTKSRHEDIRFECLFWACIDISVEFLERYLPQHSAAFANGGTEDMYHSSKTIGCPVPKDKNL